MGAANQRIHGWPATFTGTLLELVVPPPRPP
jgi:hypothetical protein